MEFRKDAPPRATIDWARSILEGLGIPALEETWRELPGLAWSLRLADPVLGVGTNGKGVTRELALAGAYAEFLERLSNDFLYPSRYGLMNGTRFRSPDLAVLPAAEAALACGGDFAWLADSPWTEPGGRVECLPFWGDREGCAVLLPRKALRHACGSNGMSAGNTLGEALAQALCEVFERWVKRSLFLTPAPAPTVPLDWALGTSNGPLIEALRGRGYGVLVKDATLGGVFPVLAVLCTATSGRAKIVLGADPDPEIALQRCLTEFCQNTGWEGLEHTMVRPALEPPEPAAALRGLMRHHFDNVFPAPLRLYFGAEGMDFLRAFPAACPDSRKALDWVLRVARGQGWRLYARNASHLGFPACQVYVPGVSELAPLSLAEVHARKEEMFAGLDGLLVRGGPDGPGLERLERALDTAVESGMYPFDWNFGVNRAFRLLCLEPGTDFDALGFAGVGLLAACARGDAVRARAMLDRMEAGGVWAPYFACARLMFALQSQGRAEAEVRQALELAWPGGLANEVLADLAQPRAAFARVALPACGDCAACALDGACRYREWVDRVEVLNRAMAHETVDQAAAAAVLAGS